MVAAGAGGAWENVLNAVYLPPGCGDAEKRKHNHVVFRSAGNADFLLVRADVIKLPGQASGLI